MADIWNTVLTVVGDLASQLIPSVANWKSQADTNAMNQELTREGWAREDTAIQRRVADLKAAGLNPVLASGQGASSGAPIRMEAPQLGNLSLSRALASAAWKSQLSQSEADAARAASDAVTAKNRADASYTESMAAAKEAALREKRAETLMPFQQSMAENEAYMQGLQYQVAIANAAKAVAEARGADADASIRLHDKLILDKYPEMLSTSTGGTKDIMGVLGMLGHFIDQANKPNRFVGAGRSYQLNLDEALPK